MLTFPSQNDKKTEKNSDRASVLLLLSTSTSCFPHLESYG